MRKHSSSLKSQSRNKATAYVAQMLMFFEDINVVFLAQTLPLLQ